MSLNTAEACAKLCVNSPLVGRHGVHAASFYALDPGRILLQSPGLDSGRERKHWTGWRWPPGSNNPGNMDWNHRSTLGFLVIELSGQIWNVHMAQAESHTHLGPGILSHATLLLAAGPYSVPFLKEEGVPILAWSEHRHFLSWSKKADLVHFLRM